MKKPVFLKRALSLTLLACASISVWAYDADFKEGGIYYYISNPSKNTVGVTYGPEDTYYSGDVVIPETVEHDGTTYTVTGILNFAFDGCESLTSVSIPNTVTSIGYYSAFGGCTSLTSVAVPEGVRTIGQWAFLGCSSLAELTLPSSLTRILYYAFCGCTSLKEVTIPESVTSIGEGAFEGCSALTSINIPQGVTKIEESVFFGCSSRMEIAIPEGVTSIGESAFSDCSSLVAVNIPDGVTEIGQQAFSGCSLLTAVTIPDSVTSIGQQAFNKCSSLTEIYSLNPTPPAIESNTFSGVDKENCVLYVPEGSLEKYMAADYWKEFYNIAGLDEIATDPTAAVEVARYDLNGRMLSEPQPGVNIVRYSDGSAKKVMVK